MAMGVVTYDATGSAGTRMVTRWDGRYPVLMGACYGTLLIRCQGNTREFILRLIDSSELGAIHELNVRGRKAHGSFPVIKRVRVVQGFGW